MPCSFSTIAKYLGVTFGTLTSSFSRLESKGFLYKEQSEEDKRIYHIHPTPIAKVIYDEHAAFHERMIDSVLNLLTKEEIETLAGSLKKLDEFFHFYKDFKAGI